VGVEEKRGGRAHVQKRRSRKNNTMRTEGNITLTSEAAGSRLQKTDLNEIPRGSDTSPRTSTSQATRKAEGRRVRRLVRQVIIFRSTSESSLGVDRQKTGGMPNLPPGQKMKTRTGHTPGASDAMNVTGGRWC